MSARKVFLVNFWPILISLTLSIGLKESYYFRNQDSISERTFEFYQTPCYENHLDILASFPFPEIEINQECDPETDVSDSIHFLIQ